MEIPEEYKTGVLWQDIQHSELIDLIKKTDPMSEDFDSAKYTYTIAFLVMYVNQHFSLEEGYMDRYDYPDKEGHKALHKEYIQQLKKYREEYKTYSKEAATKLVKNIYRWIINHILQNDQKLGAFILKAENKLYGTENIK